MKIAVDMGHTLTGVDTGAQGCGFREEIKTREIGRFLLALFIQDGHTVVDCTVDSAGSLNDSLAARVNKANSNNVDLFVSIHLNAFNKEARGVETHVYNNCSQDSIDYAQKVQKEMCKLRYVDRGVKKGKLYVVKNTNSPAILVECGFIDNAGDMALYNAEAIAKAIFTGITGREPGKNEWIKDSKGYWYKHRDGSFTRNDWEQIEGKWYYFNQDGYMCKGWLFKNQQYYYLGSDGAMLTGWQKIKEKWYYFDLENGRMRTDKWIQSYDKEKWYYVGKDGGMLLGGEYKIDDKWYAFNQDGIKQ